MMQDFRKIKYFFENNIPFCKLLKMELIEISDGFAKLKVPFNEVLIGDPVRRALHGGVTSTVLDTIGGVAAFSKLDFLIESVSTIDIRIDYLNPGETKDIFAEAKTIKKGNKVVVTKMIAYHDPKVIIAEGKAVYNIHRRKQALDF